MARLTILLLETMMRQFIFGQKQRRFRSRYLDFCSQSFGRLHQEVKTLHHLGWGSIGSPAQNTKTLHNVQTQPPCSLSNAVLHKAAMTTTRYNNRIGFWTEHTDERRLILVWLLQYAQYYCKVGLKWLKMERFCHWQWGPKAHCPPVTQSWTSRCPCLIPKHHYVICKLAEGSHKLAFWGPVAHEWSLHHW